MPIAVALGRARSSSKTSASAIDLQPGVGQPEAARELADRDEHGGVQQLVGALDRTPRRSYSFSSSIVRSARPGVAATNSMVSPRSRMRWISATQS